MKQLLMVAGFDRYFQIARCFRDEDQRADRQLEFTQVDLEMSFVGVEDVLAVLEEVTVAGCATAGIQLARPFARISYQEAMARYGSDRPDTRIQLELVELTDVFAQSGFRAFRAAVDAGGIVKCLPVHDAGELGRNQIDRLEALVKKELGGKGLAWVRIEADGGWQSPIAKFLSDVERAAVAKRCGAQPGSLLLFQADEAAKANAILSRLRVDLGQQASGAWTRGPGTCSSSSTSRSSSPARTGKLTYVHQPFVAPLDEDLALLESDPRGVRGTHYDVVLNGVELGSGSLRNHRADVQRRIFEMLGYEKQETEARFGFMLTSLDAGAPPHGGFAYGFDRWAMVLAGCESLRDVIAFPKTQRGQDLLMGAPSSVEPKQLDDLALRIAPQARDPAGGRSAARRMPYTA